MCALHLQREVTVEVSLCGIDDTIVSVTLYDITHHDRSVVIGHRSRYTHSLSHRQLADYSKQSGKYDFLDIHCMLYFSVRNIGLLVEATRLVIIQGLRNLMDGTERRRVDSCGILGISG